MGSNPADKMFSLSYEMLDIVNYRKESQILFDVGIADALSKRLASRVLLSVIPNDGSIHLRCFESTHELLLEQLSEHKLDMILRLPGGLQPARRPALQAARWLRGQLLLQGAAAVAAFSGLPGGAQAADPGRRTAMGRQLTQWFEQQGVSPSILGEFDDAALMKAFGFFNQGIFMAPTIYREEILEGRR